MPAILDEIFDNVIDVEEKSKNRISIFLCEPSDKKDLYEIVDIRGIEGMNPSFNVLGLSDSKIIMVSSWFRKAELKKILRKNKNLVFIIRGGLNGK